MNSPEKIAGVYLRLNGFFLLPQFTLFDGQYHTHIDILGLRPPASTERCGELIFPLDDALFEYIERQVKDWKNRPVAVIAEVKGNKEKVNPGEGHSKYINHFLGGSDQIKMLFRNDRENISSISDVIEVPLKHALKWIFKRIEFIDENLGKLTKEGSWTWSESFLSDILYMKRLGVNIF